MTGYNVNIAIDKFADGVKAGNIWNFLRFNCKSICDVYQKDGEYKGGLIFS